MKQPPSLFTTTRDLLRSDGRPLKQIARESRISYSWLKKLSAGEIRDPGVSRVQRLYEFLTLKTLAL